MRQNGMRIRAMEEKGFVALERKQESLWESEWGGDSKAAGRT